MPFPNFLVIGAAKSGTTSLRGYLAQHPDIYMTWRGEPSFFVHEGERVDFCGPGDDEWTFITSIDEYRALFQDAGDERAVGEISPRYLYFERASERIQHYAPAMRLLAILRHPVDRAYSHFLMNKARNCEPAADLRAAINTEVERAARGWGWDWRYVGAGRYHEQLQRYYARFDPAQIHVMLHDDYRADPRQFFASLFSFLGVDPSFEPDTSRRYREASLPRSQALRAVVERQHPLKAAVGAALPASWRARVKTLVTAWNSTPPPALEAELRAEIFERCFEADCARLEELIGRDLRAWREPRGAAPGARA